MRLTTKVHDRDASDMTYVYPVVSRRARGVSVGINLNPNNACNWRCVYCQVPGLVRGRGPAIDLERLGRELDEMLGALLRGDYMERHVPEGSRRVNDIAFSGNGEPTGSPDFEAAVERVQAALARFELDAPPKIVVITNGSLVHKDDVRAALRRLARTPSEVWYKLDSATDAGIARMNDVQTGAERALRNLETCAHLVPTWIQTMVLARRGQPPSDAERAAYLDALAGLLERGTPLLGVHLYGLARQVHQPEASELSPLPSAWVQEYAEQIRALGLEVRVAL